LAARARTIAAAAVYMSSMPVSAPRSSREAWLPQLYLQRFPLLLGGFLLAYVPFALYVVPAMFRSTLVLTAWGLAFVTLLSFLTAMVVMALRRTVILCGPARFGVHWLQPSPAVTIRSFALHMLAACPLVAVAGVLSAGEGELGMAVALAAVIAGFAGAAACQLAIQALQAWFVDEDQPLPEMAILNPRAVAYLHRHSVPPTPVGGLVRWLLDWVRPLLGPGYFARDGRLEPAQVYAVVTCLLFLALYIGGYILGHPRFHLGVPPLLFELLLATLTTIVLAGLAFWLDRFRVPTLLVVGAWMAALSWAGGSDHYFRLKPAARPMVAPSPYELAHARRPLLAVVAVDGGGIQAAAWAATVLTRVEGAWPEFHRSVGVISAISGGSVGTMYFVSALHPDRPMTDPELEHVRDEARQPSLSEAGWGLAYGDVWRALMPPIVRFEKDRAWAMEQAWRRTLAGGPIPTLGDWIDGARSGWMPSLALNATIVESGQRFSFATFTPPEALQESPDDVRPWNLGTLLRTYPNHDIEIPTAARLTATFPYVTPIATAWPEPGVPAWHFADGGYYDNTGMGIAMRWLDTALRGNPSEFTGVPIAFIRIRSAPYTADPPPKERAWTYEAVGPIETLVHVRNAGQLERAETELDFLRRMWHDEHVEISCFDFAFDLPGPPLSWQLTKRDIDRLDEAWGSLDNQNALRRFLALRDPSAPASCAPAQ
jgi:hypothetical protein